MNSSPMSVCGQMGNAHTKGGKKKKKKDLEMGSTCLDSDPPRLPQEVENGDVEQTEEGLRQFTEEKGKRQERMRDIGKLMNKSQEPHLDAERQENIHVEDASTNQTVNHNGTLQSGCGESVLNAASEGNGNSVNDNAASAQEARQDEGERDLSVTCGDSHQDHSHVPQGGSNQGNETTDGSESVTPEVPGNIGDNFQGTYIQDSLGHSTTSSTPGQDKPDSDSSYATRCGNETAQSNSKTPIQKKTPQEQTEYSSPPSIPPTTQSKKESSNPEATQIVPGINQKGSAEDAEAEKLQADQLNISEVITDGSTIMERLSKYLDRESRVIKCWKHLAYVLGVPPDETRQFDMYTEHSPTEDLFNFLSDSWNPDLTVRELKVKLKNIHRNDVIESLNKGQFRDEMRVSDLISGEPKFTKLLSPKLDVESRTIGNWRSLATEFGIRKQKADQFGLRGPGPSAALFAYMRTAKDLCDLTMEQLRKHFEGMERKDLVNILDKENIEGSRFVRHVLVDESQLLADIGERLNKDIRAIKNWRNLAYRLKIPPETYNTFDTSKAKAKSPTKMMFEWLAKWKPSLNVGDLLEAIREIDRYDVVELVKKEAELALPKHEKKELDVVDHYETDGAAQQSTAKQLSDLEQMRHDSDKCNISDLKRNAGVKGFKIQDNQGGGNCMFYALSRQLEIKKGVKISCADLRKKIVEYLKQNRVQPDGDDLYCYIHGYQSWPQFLEEMAKDGTWGDHLILLAAANIYKTPICVISSLIDRDVIVVNRNPPFSSGSEPLVLGHVFEFHYVSLEPMSEGCCQMSDGKVHGGQYLRERQQLQDTEYGQSLHSPTYQQQQQGHQQGQGFYQSQGPCQSQGLYQSPGPYPANGPYRQQGPHQSQGPYQPQGYCQSQGNQGRWPPRQPQEQRAPLSIDDKIAIKVWRLPIEVYSKICVKLSIKRNMTFDDFRVVAEQLGMDADTREFLGQQKNPTDVMFKDYQQNVTVGELIKILHQIERFDVAAVLEEWIKEGSALQS